MRQRPYLFLLICVLGILCILAVYKQGGSDQTAFPLEEDVVTEILEKVGLPGVISQAETSSPASGSINFVVRSETEYYEGTENPVLIAGISSANYKGKRILSTVFDQSVVSEQIEWEDWKQQIVFATLLYGDFENEEEVYLAFLENEIPEGKTAFTCDAQLSSGYCTVSYRPRNHTIYDENGFAVKKRSASMWVNIYESYELYQELKAVQEKAR